MPSALETLDTLLDAFRHALSTEDMVELNRITEAVRPAIQAAMADVKEGNTDSGALQERLLDLQALTERASQDASKAREEAAKGLREINQNRNAVNAYANVRNRGSRY
ncbi:hypothetical protein RE428_30010 [Marinobacter nanhaiticus D15-8W]|uniref:SOS cell division inhibitor n=1 Tax=Marinobacter nanhaiticus D15-8W TaxID=626887 RepID=N6WZM4_9GAMM|nr:hypothetical protein [Marinobacter nanhaiticus]ENO17021.1 hypothetical protein J057_01239 [Marinobacter nanhaiticus D15-8W]BES71983.1 hypothetical protein RE428_30010 [Marinobacter nanhaiticus D15-8W]